MKKLYWSLFILLPLGVFAQEAAPAAQAAEAAPATEAVAPATEPAPAQEAVAPAQEAAEAAPVITEEAKETIIENVEAAKVKPWKFSGDVGLTITGNGVINWAAGGRSQVDALLFTLLKLQYEKDKLMWTSNLDCKYGALWKDQKYDQFQETADKLSFNTKLGYQVTDKVYASFFGSFLSQFGPTYKYTNDLKPDYIQGKFLAPSTTNITIGIDYDPFPWLSLFVSPAACRIRTAVVTKKENMWAQAAADSAVAHKDVTGYTEEDAAKYHYVVDDNGRLVSGLEKELKDKYGVWRYADDGYRDYSKDYNAEVGFLVRAEIDYKYKNLQIKTSLELYTPYQWNKTKVYYETLEGGDRQYHFNPTDEEIASKNMTWEGYYDKNRRFGNFDVDFDFAISYQFLKVLEVTLFSDLVYVNGERIQDKGDGTSKSGDDGVEKVQWKTIFGLGVGYQF